MLQKLRAADFVESRHGQDIDKLHTLPDYTLQEVLLKCVVAPIYGEDWIYFWRKAGKALKKSWKTGKNTGNVAGNRKTLF